MSSRVSPYRPTTLPENVKDIPVIKQGPSITKFSLNTQGNSMDSAAVRAAALFYLILSIILFLASPSMGARINTRGKKSFSIIYMGAFFINLIVSFTVIKYVYSFKSH